MDDLRDRLFDLIRDLLVMLVGKDIALVAQILLILALMSFALVWSYYDKLLQESARADATPVTIKEYAGLRENQDRGGSFSKGYENVLASALDAVDRFFNDFRQSRTSWPSPFGNRIPAPFWTPSSYNRCLLLALVYPIGSIFFLWVTTGTIGPAERALGVPELVPTPARWAAAALALISIVAFLQVHRARTWIFTSAAYCILSAAVATAIALASFIEIERDLMKALVAGAMFLLLGTLLSRLVVAFTHAQVTTIAGAGAVGVSFAVSIVFGIASGGGSLVFALVGGVLAVLVPILTERLIAGFSNQRGFILLVATGFYLVAAPVVANRLQLAIGQGANWTPLLFFGLLACVNAPFDWASLGVTRAALRRALETPSYASFFFWSLLDSLLAVALLLALAFLSIIAVQILNVSVMMSGGSEPFALKATFAVLRDSPLDVSVWW